VENHQTMEKFAVTKEETTESYWISRHPMVANAEWIEGMRKFELRNEHGNILIGTYH
jgi:hypothetical protein